MFARGPSVMFLSPEPVGEELTGPTRRAIKLAEALSDHCRVTLAAPSPSRFPDGPFQVLETGPQHAQRLGRAFSEHDVVVVQTLPSPRQLIGAIRRAPSIVVDLIAPLAFEASEVPAGSAARMSSLTRWRTRELIAHLAAADLVLCTNEKQRDFLIGAAVGAGVLALAGTGRGTLPAERIVVVPHGIDEEPPRHTRRVLRGANSIGDADRIVVWAGGMWSWLDPLTPIKAVERLRATRPDVKLAFVGLAHPDPDARRAHEAGAREAVAYARDRGLGAGVVFRHEWLSSEDYTNHLLESDVGVATARPTLESRFATRTRVLDYLSAGLPVVCSANDAMSAFVEANGLGRVVEPLEVGACAAALDQLTGPGQARIEDRSALAPFQWHRVARPLVEFCLNPPSRTHRRITSLALTAREYPAFLRAVYREGTGTDFVRALLRRARRGR